MGNRLGLLGCGKILLGLALGVPFVSPNCNHLKPSVSRCAGLLLEPTAAAWSPQTPPVLKIRLGETSPMGASECWEKRLGCGVVSPSPFSKGPGCGAGFWQQEEGAVSRAWFWELVNIHSTGREPLVPAAS